MKTPKTHSLGMLWRLRVWVVSFRRGEDGILSFITVAPGTGRVMLQQSQPHVCTSSIPVSPYPSYVPGPQRQAYPEEVINSPGCRYVPITAETGGGPGADFITWRL
ncbi:hypothetical protein Bbelb_134990 [Branchiostoma belcheri]|nr:hypothetical protein Bbelb_134990 [Branchiostoma belcheri]